MGDTNGTNSSVAGPRVAFVTVSYAPDHDRCALLCRSLDALAPAHSDHLIIVNRADVPLFRELASERRHVLATEDVLPKRFLRLEARRVGLRSNVYLHTGKPIRGWLLQQLVKLAACREVSADAIVHADSDVCLVRPFETESVIDVEGRVRLYCTRGAIEASLQHHVRWHRSAERLLGLAPRPLPLPDYIGGLVTWRRENALALLDFLDGRFRRSWMTAIASAWDVSEYILYGRFAEDVLGGAGAQFLTDSRLCHDYFGAGPLSEADVEALIAGLSDDQVGLSITAKAGMSPHSYASVLERQWTQLASTCP